jgi:hypothetical protein
MANTTDYDTLVADIKRETEDDSPEHLEVLDGNIARGQDRLQRDLDLTIFRSFTTAALTSGSNEYTHPSTWLDIRSIQVTVGGDPIEKRSLDFCRMMTGSGTPRFYARLDADTIYFAPQPDAATSCIFQVVNREAALTSAATTNWFTTHAADCLLLACLIESERFLKGNTRLAQFKTEYMERLTGLRGELRGLMREAYQPLMPSAVVVSPGGAAG